MLPVIAPGMFSNVSHEGSNLLPTTHVLHLAADGSGDYGENQGITTTIWSGEFGSVTATTVPSGTLGSFELTALATASASNFYVIIKGVQTRDFFDRISVQGILDTSNSADSTAYFVTDADGGEFFTFWRWDGTGIGNFATLGDRNVGFDYNSIYQTNATTETFIFSPNSLYAWFSWPDPDTGDADSYQAQAAQGGKMDVFAAFSSSLYPSDGSFGDPAIYGKHNGVSIAKITSSGEEWVLLYLQNSSGTENYRITSPCWSGNLDTVDATYHSTDNDVNWGTKAFGWLVSTLGWGGVGFDNFTITNLD